MRAVVARRYGPPEVLAIERVPRPVPRAGEVLVRVARTSVSAGDCEVRRFDFGAPYWLLLRLALGVLRPRRGIWGQEFAGEIEALGDGVGDPTEAGASEAGVEGWTVGDRVFGPTDALNGTWAEFVRLPADGPFARVPDGLDLDRAACLSMGGLNALAFLRRAAVGEGDTLLVNGAGGSIGTALVPLARSRGVRVVAVDRAEKLDLVRELGAERVLDFAREDPFAERERYDAIVDVPAKAPFFRALRSLVRGGRLVLTYPRFAHLVLVPIARLFTGRRARVAVAGESRAALERLAALALDGTLPLPIDRTVDLEEIVAANRFVESGVKAGNLVVRVGGADAPVDGNAADDERGRG